MPTRQDWDASSAIASLNPQPWTGRVWRFHRRLYEAADAGGSLRKSGRYHKAIDLFHEPETWPALYTAIEPETALGEVVRHFSLELLPRLNEYRLSELDVVLSSVIDCRSAGALGLEPSELVDDRDYTVTQAIAAAAIARGAEAILVPSATALGDNLVVFPRRLQASSRLTVVGSREPRLHVSR